ncbi:MAG: patatin-like phospholipase family protein [Trueperaceae bacterium]|nr:patatin-like phospholipase family protein [Trueperaceae bacterium]
MERVEAKKQVGLILSGGGARGFAHIGVLKALEQTDIQIDVVAGTSMGAVLGAFHAAGYKAESIYKIAKDLSWRDVLDLSLNSGFIKGDKLHRFLSEYLPRNFKDLKKPLAVTTTDIETGEEVVIMEGDLITALRASSCYPGAFEPLQFRGRTLADGGIVNNLPVEALSFLHATYTIASDCTPPRRASYVDPNEEGNWWERFVATVRFERRNPMAQMVLRSSDVMQSILTEMQYCLHPADIRIRHFMPEIRLESFWSFEAIVKLGESACLETFSNAGINVAANKEVLV